MYFLPTSLIFLSYFILTLVYILENRKIKIENHLFVNELLIALLLLIAGILYPFIYRFHSPGLSVNSLNYLWLSTSIIFLIEMGFLVITLIHNYNFKKKS